MPKSDIYSTWVHLCYLEGMADREPFYCLTVFFLQASRVAHVTCPRLSMIITFLAPICFSPLDLELTKIL